MEIIINKTDGQIMITIIGRLDTPNAKIFEEKIQDILQDEQSNVRIDCTALEYISSSGLRQFFTLFKHVKSVNRSIKVTNLNSEVKEIFDMTGFSNIFNI